MIVGNRTFLTLGILPLSHSLKSCTTSDNLVTEMTLMALPVHLVSLALGLVL